jgi:hypothetical protein
MHTFLDFVIGFCESIFFFGLMDNLFSNLPLGLAVEPIPADQIDPECPVRYRLRPFLESPPESGDQPVE